MPPRSMAARYGGEEFLAVVCGCAGGGLGVATATELIVAAGRALYRAKQDGRDCVIAASQTLAAAS